MSQQTHNASDKEAWTLPQWLDYLEQIHPSNIELGLERVAAVYLNLSLDLTSKTVVTVAGTNGKGTTCALIEQAILAYGDSVAVFSSPHLIDYRERVRVQGQMLSPEQHCQAFLAVEEARKDISLTYFEFGTLAALYIMAHADTHYLLLEVGLGGRLDAVNVVDPDVAVITGIDLDHQDWLGDTKEQIAVEKAGIFRANIPAIIGDPLPPSTLFEAAKQHQVNPLWQGKEFRYQCDDSGFHWQGVSSAYTHLPIPKIPLQNASTALQVIDTLKLSLDSAKMVEVFNNTFLAGRRQIVQTAPTVMLDVAHNPQATRLLAEDLARKNNNQVIAVVAMLADKDSVASLTPMLSAVTTWHCAPLDVPRGATANSLVSVLSPQKNVLEFDSVEQAYLHALKTATKEDLVIVFGSFFTVGKVLNYLEKAESLTSGA